VVSLTLRPLYPRGKIPLYAEDRRMGGPQKCPDAVEERNGFREKFEAGHFQLFFSEKIYIVVAV
jgi:hypothetical protein